VIAVGLGGFAVYQLKAALSQVDLLRQQVDLLADQVKLQRDDLALQREAIAAEAERNRKRDELLDGQLEELRRRQRALDRQQANRIRVEWDQSGPPPGVEVEQGDAVHVALVINKSPRPIREVRAGMSLHNEKYRHASSIRPILGDAPAPAYEVQDYRVDVVQADVLFVGGIDWGSIDLFALWVVLRPRLRRFVPRFESIHADMAAELALTSSGMTMPFPCAILLAYNICAGLAGLGSSFLPLSPSTFLGECSLRNFRQIDIDVL